MAPTRRLRAIAVLTAAWTLTTGTAPQASVGRSTVLTVDAAAELGSINRNLVGFGWHEGGAPIAAVAALRPHFVRVDASLERVSTGPGVALRLVSLLEHIAAVRAAGAEPLVILSYVPAWLGEPVAAGRDPTRVRPADLDAWEALVREVVRVLATAPDPARYFEAWNEPDIPLFWQDTPTAWVDTVERTALAVAAVRSETGADLRFGGPATAVPDPAYLVPFLSRLRAHELPPDFVSWHYYGNYPFFGPDGAEFAATEPVQPLVGRRNPVTSPAVFAPQAQLMRSLTKAVLGDSGHPPPALVIDEWNLSAAGYDRRHDTAEGAAFAAGVLVELQSAGLDAAVFFMANDTRGVPGEHGAVRRDGTRKPVWWAFDLWQRQRRTRVEVRGATHPHGLWAIGSADDDAVAVLLSSFNGSARRIRLELGASVDRVTVRRVDPAHSSGAVASPLAIRSGTVTLDLPASGVALVEGHLKR